MTSELRTGSEQAAIDQVTGAIGEDSRDQAERMVHLAWYCTVKGTTGNIPVVTKTLSGGEISVVYDGAEYKITQ